MNKVNGVRISGAMSYLTPAVRSRANLTIQSETLAHRVLFTMVKPSVLKSSAKVKFKRFSVRVSPSPVALSGTPGLLLRSGTGAKKDIYRLGVSLVSDVPGVGSRLLDHPGAAFFMMPRPGIAKRNRPTHPNALTIHLRARRISK